TRARSVSFQFGPRAAKLYHVLAGEKAAIGCGDPTVADDGSVWFFGSTDGTRLEGRAGYWWARRTLPRKRGTIRIARAKPTDVCFIATKERRRDDFCLPLNDDNLCLRLVVTRSDKGRAGLDARERALEVAVGFETPLDELHKLFGASS